MHQNIETLKEAEGNVIKKKNPCFMTDNDNLLHYSIYMERFYGAYDLSNPTWQFSDKYLCYILPEDRLFFLIGFPLCQTLDFILKLLL